MQRNNQEVIANEVIIDERRGIATHSKSVTNEQFAFYYRNYQKWARPDLYEYQQYRWQALALIGEKFMGLLRNK